MNPPRRSPIWLIAAVLLGAAALVVFIVRDPQQHQTLPVPRGTEAPPPASALGAPPVDPKAPPPPPPEPLTPQREDAPGAPQGEISGRVVSSETRAIIPGAEVTWSSARGAHSARTDLDGRFVFRPPQAGNYQLASTKADGYLPFGPEWGRSPVAIAFRPGERVAGLTVELTFAPDVTGRVLDAKGQPVAKASARVLVPRRDEIALFPMRDRFATDARGEFVFRAEPYAVVEAWHLGLGSGRERLEPGQRELTITLEPDPADAGARVSLSGRVVSGGRPVPGALVNVPSALRAYPRVFGSIDGSRELTDDDGKLEVTELQPGTYDVTAHLLGTAPAHRFDVPVPARDVVLELGSGMRRSAENAPGRRMNPAELYKTTAGPRKKWKRCVRSSDRGRRRSPARDLECARLQ